ncbi:MAG: 23S rRNA (guanosine(2251)-2'-O)-methyltransferase RlmB [Gammaproteobacteria bacterium]|nr:23S rRNA (guanosine(2251)-2'-O)-methyltransferase RlmB [Gammaproteobacteria bacterium]MDE0285996.1 23S rRNA (guanosine(2251)-2'-O)-methyltransferase RlmB [Gammaproteobacteria bacterium]MDE0512293.1 23S rRNA (guanosine(2251)-2'-O)-methyltransferase RlmB [Gammaproteobacteria bacterium]
MPGKKVEIICGYHAVRHVLTRRSHEVLEVYVSTGRGHSAKLDDLLHSCERNSIAVNPISRAKLDRLTGTDHHQGIAARCRSVSADKQVTITDLCAGNLSESSIILVLDRVMDPHNLGACIRTADAAGVAAVILPKDHSAPVNATVKKVASGAAESTDIITVINLARSLRQLREAGCQVIGTADDAAQSIYDVDVTFPPVLVMGSEEDGMRQNTRNHCDQLVKIPMYGSVESLNLSVATGVCLYELQRRITENNI